MNQINANPNAVKATIQCFLNSFTFIAGLFVFLSIVTSFEISRGAIFNTLALILFADKIIWTAELQMMLSTKEIEIIPATRFKTEKPLIVE